MNNENSENPGNQRPYFVPSAPSGASSDAGRDLEDLMQSQSQIQPQSPPRELPGLMSLTYAPSNDVENMHCVLKLLQAAAISACIVDVNALRYYGAGRVTREWDICIPSSELDRAVEIFDNNSHYQRAKSPPPVPNALRHMNPCFQLKDVIFYFLLVPSSRYFFMPSPATIVISKKGLPYPRMPQFAHSLLVLQKRSNLGDFIDGMDLDEAWGDTNIDFNWLNVEGKKFAIQHNETLLAQNLCDFNTDTDFREVWREIVRTKEGRIEPMKKGRYRTCWRRVHNDIDPRDREREM